MLSFEKSSKRNVAIAFSTLAVSTACFGPVGYAMMTPFKGGPGKLAGPQQMLSQAMQQSRSGNGGISVIGAPTNAQKPLNIAAFSLGVKPYGVSANSLNESAIPMDSNSLALLGDSRNAGDLLTLCQKLANPDGTGRIDARCMLKQNHQGSGVLFGALANPEADPVAGTNWNPASLTVPDQLDGSDRQKQYEANLKSYGALTTDDLHTNYDITISNSYYKYWTGVNAAWLKQIGQPMPGMKTIWGHDGATVNLEDGSSVTYKAGAAG